MSRIAWLLVGIGVAACGGTAPAPDTAEPTAPPIAVSTPSSPEELADAPPVEEEAPVHNERLTLLLDALQKARDMEFNLLTAHFEEALPAEHFSVDAPRLTRIQILEPGVTTEDLRKGIEAWNGPRPEWMDFYTNADAIDGRGQKTAQHEMIIHLGANRVVFVRALDGSARSITVANP